MKRFISIIILLTSIIFSNAQNLSENAQISLITCNPGNELYSVFGHSALRVKDYDQGIDKVYNYGTFDFNTPNFYLKFIKGDLNYQLSVYSMHSFMREYEATNRSVFEQVLILDSTEKEQIYNFLEYNAQPENKYYLYDFFFDNCATRIRDVFYNEYPDSIKLDAATYSSHTYRELIMPYLKPQPWSRFGINLVLGEVADKQASMHQSAFLPDYLSKVFAHAKLKGDALVEPVQTLFKEENSDNKTPFYELPIFVFSVLFILLAAITYFEIKYKKRYKLIDFLLFLSVGAVGLIIFLLWFATNHTAVVQNWNLLWAIPLHFFIAFWLFRKRKSFWLKYYFLLVSIGAFAVLCCWFIIPQQFDYAFIPIFLTISLRAFNIFRYY